MFAEAIDRILRDQCTPSVVRSIEAGGSSAALWQAVGDAGFFELMASESDGGAGLSLSELFPVISSFGRYAVPLPLSQTIVSRVLLRGHAVPDGMVTLAPQARRCPDGGISCSHTPYGALADVVIMRDGDGMLVLPTDRARREASGIWSSQIATLSWADDRDAVRISKGGELVTAFGAALYAGMLTGAMARVFEMTLQYCNDRVQFGKSLGKFQAVQHQLSVMAEHVAASTIAAQAAFHCGGMSPGMLSAAVAKSRTSEAAVLVASTAHALHGALGITEEYDLQLFTRRLHEWRMVHGSEAHWNAFVGRRVLGGACSLSGFVQSLLRTS